MSTALAKLEAAKDRFVAIYKAVHKVSDEDAANFYEVEAFNFKRMIQENDYLSDCSELSVAGTFLEVISNGLSFDKSSKHVYLIPRNVKTSSGWEKRLTYSYAADGIVYLCTQAGSISSCTTPIIVYEGDDIKVSTSDGRLTVNHTKAIPRASNRILGGYCTVILTNGERQDFWMGVEEVSRLMDYSKKNNKSKNNPEGKANDLYTSGDDGQIDTGFFQTKIVKAALKNCRKKRTLSDNLYEEDAIDVDLLPSGNEAEETTSPANIEEPVELAF